LIERAKREARKNKAARSESNGQRAVEKHHADSEDLLVGSGYSVTRREATGPSDVPASAIRRKSLPGKKPVRFGRTPIRKFTIIL
jgi:hypothetical protein